MRISTEERATESPLMHSVDAEGNVWEHGTLLPRGPYERGAVEAIPHPPGDGSCHLLRSPTGEEHVFAWRADMGAWVPRERMSRIAFDPGHLGSLGWMYARFVPPEETSAPEHTETPRRSRRSRE